MKWETVRYHICNGFIYVLDNYDSYLTARNIDYSRYVLPTRIRHLLRHCPPIEIVSPCFHLHDRTIDGVLKLNETPKVSEVLDEAAFRPGNPKLILQPCGGRHVVHVHADLIGDVVRQFVVQRSLRQTRRVVVHKDHAGQKLVRVGQAAGRFFQLLLRGESYCPVHQHAPHHAVQHADHRNQLLRLFQSPRDLAEIQLGEVTCATTVFLSQLVLTQLLNLFFKMTSLELKMIP